MDTLILTKENKTKETESMQTGREGKQFLKAFLYAHRETTGGLETRKTYLYKQNFESI